MRSAMRSDGSAAPTCAAVDEHGARRGEQLRERKAGADRQDVREYDRARHHQVILIENYIILKLFG